MGMPRVGDVLVVDDDASIVAFIADCLDEEGYTVRIASDASAALDVIQTNPPALVLLDIMMPGMTGDVLLDYLRHNGFPDLPIIVMSAVSSASAFVLTGATEYLPKPFRIDDLLDCVNRYCLPRSG
jgi:two-component system, NtrC family, nitrogen regulation response regulator NtrX